MPTIKNPFDIYDLENLHVKRSEIVFTPVKHCANIKYIFDRVAMYLIFRLLSDVLFDGSSFIGR